MSYDAYLGPSDEWRPLLDRGVVALNAHANRLIWVKTGRFAAALTPTIGLGNRLTAEGTWLDANLAASSGMAQLRPILEMVRMISSAGALASVATLGVCVAGFAIVLHRLASIEGKLDEMLATLDELKTAVRDVGGTVESFLLARLAAAHENLERSIAAETERERIALARDARRLFQESRLRYLGLWQRSAPWSSAQIEISAALELQGRYVASAVGELQAELVLGDTGAFVHAARAAARCIRETMFFEPRTVLRARGDSAVAHVGSSAYSASRHAAFVEGSLRQLSAKLRMAHDSTFESAKRLEAAEHDAELPLLLDLPAHELLRLTRRASGSDVVAVGNLRRA